jgi:Tfp pilus assembly protein PilX
MSKYYLKNQSGMAPIMFAIFMAIILTLMAIGFAVLSRNDQRQTLDRTLSNQANYAAESAINRIQSEYQNDINFAENNDCDGSDSGVEGVINNLNDNIHANVQTLDITCLTWTSKLTMLWKSNLNSTPWVVPVIPESGAVDTLRITWSPAESPANSSPTTDEVATLTLTNGNLPTLRIAAASTANVSNTSVIFINPGSSGGSGTLAYGIGSGSIANAKCDTSGASGDWQCTIDLAIGANWNDGRLSITSLNGSSNVSIQALSAGSVATLIKAQAKVDATAKSQDVIRRLIAYVPLTKTTWQPSFVVSSDGLCKNYRVDGATNNVAGPVSTDLCPN